MLEGGRLGIRKLGFGYGGFFWVIGKSFNNCFTIGAPLFRWCFSLRGPIFFFPLGAPLFLLEFNFKVSRGICCKGLHPLGFSFNLFRDHCFFVSFSFFGFIFVVFILFDGVLIGNIFGFFFKHIQVNIHLFNSTFNWWAFRHGSRTPLRFI